MPLTEFQLEELSYILKRSRRRTLALSVRPSGLITAHAPRWILERSVHQFVRHQLPWIRRTLTKLQDPSRRATTLSFSEGTFFPLWGQPRAVRRIEIKGRTLRARFDDQFLILEGPASVFTDRRLIRATRLGYKETVEARLQERVPYWAARMGVTPGNVSIGFAKRRWGSCSPRGSLRFNGRLAMHAPNLLDYVIVHELAHLLHRNHGPRFWNEVSAQVPDHKALRRQLLLESRLTPPL